MQTKAVIWRAKNRQDAEREAMYAQNEWTYYGLPIRIYYLDDTGREVFLAEIGECLNPLA